MIKCRFKNTVDERKVFQNIDSSETFVEDEIPFIKVKKEDATAINLLTGELKIFGPRVVLTMIDINMEIHYRKVTT